MIVHKKNRTRCIANTNIMLKFLMQDKTKCCVSDFNNEFKLKDFPFRIDDDGDGVWLPYG